LVARQWRRAEARSSNGSLAAEERGNRKIASGISGAIAPSANRQKPGQVNVVVCESDYRALKRGIEHLPPPPQ
jgi:hypothetical protein